MRYAASVLSFFLVSSLLGVAEVGPAELGEAVAVDLLVQIGDERGIAPAPRQRKALQLRVQRGRRLAGEGTMARAQGGWAGELVGDKKRGG